MFHICNQKIRVPKLNMYVRCFSGQLCLAPNVAILITLFSSKCVVKNKLQFIQHFQHGQKSFNFLSFQYCPDVSKLDGDCIISLVILDIKSDVKIVPQVGVQVNPIKKLCVLFLVQNIIILQF